MNPWASVKQALDDKPQTGKARLCWKDQVKEDSLVSKTEESIFEIHILVGDFSTWELFEL